MGNFFVFFLNCNFKWSDQLANFYDDNGTFSNSVIGGILHIRDSNGLGNKVFLFILTAILCLVIFSSPLGRKLIAKSETIHEVQNVVKTKLKDQYYGLNLLKNGDLKQRKKKIEDALEITMTTPQSIYLRGFVRGRFSGMG